MALASTSCSCVHVPGPLLLHHSSHWHGHTRGGHSVTPICTVLTAKTTVKRFWLSLLLLDRLTALQNGSWLFSRTGTEEKEVTPPLQPGLLAVNTVRMGVTIPWSTFNIKFPFIFWLPFLLIWVIGVIQQCGFTHTPWPWQIHYSHTASSPLSSYIWLNLTSSSPHPRRLSPQYLPTFPSFPPKQ